MISLKIGCHDFLMAAAALVNDVEFEPFLIGAGNSMRSMAVVAHRERLIRFGGAGEMHACGKHFINAIVTLGAGLGDIIAVDAGGRVIMW